MSATPATERLRSGLFRVAVALHLRRAPEPRVIPVSVPVPVIAPSKPVLAESDPTPEEVLECNFLMTLRPGFVHVGVRTMDKPVGHLVVLVRPYTTTPAWSASALCEAGHHFRTGRGGQALGTGPWRLFPLTRLKDVEPCAACLAHAMECDVCERASGYTISIFAARAEAAHA